MPRKEKRDCRPGRPRPPRGGLPALESLETRLMPSLTFQFANGIGAVGNGSVDVESNSVVNDSSGNVYVTGSLQGTADFDPGSGTTNLSSAGNRDVFLAKFNQAGALVWAKDLPGLTAQSVAQGAAIAVDSSGNVIVAGTFTGTVNFDPNSGSTTFTSALGGNDVFIAKYDPNGNLLWAQNVGGTAGALDEGYALAVDTSGNIALAGSFQNTAIFGTTTLTAGGTFEAFVAKLNSSGQFLWAKSTTGSGSSVVQANGVTFDGSGNVISTGFFAGTVDFNTGSAVTTLPYSGSEDIYVQKLDANGNFVWAESFGSPDIDQGQGIAADASGNLYITGTFSDTVDFNPAAGAAANLTAGGFEDAFLLQLNSSGQFGWAKDLAVTGFNAARGTGVGLDGSGHVFVAGYYQGALTLDPIASGASLTSAGDFDVFVGEYSTAGTFVAGQSAGGANFDAEFGIGVNSSGQVAIAGRYSGPAPFGTISLPSQPNKSIFIAQLTGATTGTNGSAPPAPGTPVLEAASDTGLSNSDDITNLTTLVLDENTVSAPGNTVQLLRDGVVVASRVGSGALTDPGPIADGVHVYTAQQVDTSGRTSPVSAGLSVTVDTKAPSAPAALVLNPADDSGVKGDNITNVKQPRLTGTADGNALMQLLDSFGDVLGATTTAANGSYTFTGSRPPVRRRGSVSGPRGRRRR